MPSTLAIAAYFDEDCTDSPVALCSVRVDFASSSSVPADFLTASTATAAPMRPAIARLPELAIPPSEEAILLCELSSSAAAFLPAPEKLRYDFEPMSLAAEIRAVDPSTAPAASAAAWTIERASPRKRTSAVRGIAAFSAQARTRHNWRAYWREHGAHGACLAC